MIPNEKMSRYLEKLNTNVPVKMLEQHFMEFQEPLVG
jgi:hypothetical protein